MTASDENGIPLSPCPFCGSSDLSSVRDGWFFKKYYYVECNACGCLGPDHDDDLHWNHRAVIAKVDEP